MCVCVWLCSVHVCMVKFIGLFIFMKSRYFRVCTYVCVHVHVCVIKFINFQNLLQLAVINNWFVKDNNMILIQITLTSFQYPMEKVELQFYVILISVLIRLYMSCDMQKGCLIYMRTLTVQARLHKCIVMPESSLFVDIEYRLRIILRQCWGSLSGEWLRMCIFAFLSGQIRNICLAPFYMMPLIRALWCENMSWKMSH